MRNPLVFLDWSTNAYQSADLSLTRPSICFTKHYHRGLGRGIDLSVPGSVAGWTSVGQGHVQPEWWHTRENRRNRQGGSARWHTGQVGVGKKNLFQIGHGRIAFNEHGGKTGRAMIKYPHIQKNAQGLKRALYPGRQILQLCYNGL